MNRIDLWTNRDVWPLGGGLKSGMDLEGIGHL